MPRERRITARRLSLAVLSGVLFALSFPPADLGLLAWGALVPLLLSIDGLEPRRAFRIGYFCGLTAFLFVVSWIRAYGFPVWLLLSAYLALQFAAFAGAYRWIAQERPAWMGIAAVPLLWTSLEYLRSSGAFGFPWALLGLTQHSVLPVIQVAAIAGVFGVSCLVALGSALLLSLLRKRFDIATVIVIVIAVTVAWGGREVGQTRPTASTEVAALQPNVDPKAKFEPLFTAQIVSKLERLTEVAAENDPALIVFPETAVPVNLFGPAGALPEIGRWATRARTTLIVSSLENGRSNIAVAVAASGQAVDRYDKVRLVAFGEAGIQPGSQHKALWTPSGSVGIAICFESIFPAIGRALTRNGARALAIITNDAVIATNAVDRWSGPDQHAAHSIMRAVETGRWVIRAANTGVTKLIDPSGRIRGEIPRGQAGILTGQIALTDTWTIYTTYGDLFAVGAVVVSLLLSIPAAAPWLAAQWRRPPFQQALAGTLLPFLAASTLLRSQVAVWVWTTLLMAFTVIFSLPRRPSSWGLSRRGAMTSISLALVVVSLLWVLISSAYRAQQIPILLIAPASGWVRFAAGQLLIAAAVEAWLRGYAFSALQDSVGVAWTVAVTTFLGVLLQAGQPAEAYAWAICTGVAFGMIRARTGNVLGPVAGHTLGNVLMSAIAAVR